MLLLLLQAAPSSPTTAPPWLTLAVAALGPISAILIAWITRKRGADPIKKSVDAMGKALAEHGATLAEHAALIRDHEATLNEGTDPNVRRRDSENLERRMTAVEAEQRERRAREERRAEEDARQDRELNKLLGRVEEFMRSHHGNGRL